MFEVGKLYRCEKYHLLLYPDPDAAAAAARSHQPSSAAPNSGNPATFADFWSNRFGKSVFYADKNIPLLCLNNKEEYIEVLAGDKKVWIIFKDWLNIKEIE